MSACLVPAFFLGATWKNRWNQRMGFGVTVGWVDGWFLNEAGVWRESRQKVEKILISETNWLKNRDYILVWECVCVVNDGWLGQSKRGPFYCKILHTSCLQQGLGGDIDYHLHQQPQHWMYRYGYIQFGGGFWHLCALCFSGGVVLGASVMRRPFRLAWVIFWRGQASF